MLLLFGFLLISIGIVTYYIPQNQPQQVAEVKGEKAGRADIYPNASLTPGDTFPTATKDTVCVKGYTKTVRNVTTTTKKEIYTEYGLTYPQPAGSYEVDHFIPLALGGSNDPKNLWPEPASPKPGFHEKDVVELYLYDELCTGKMTLIEAQNEIRSDWYAVYEQIPNKAQYNYYSD